MRTKEQQVKHLNEMAEYSRQNAAEYEAAAKWVDEHGDKLDGIDYEHYGSFINVKTPKRETLFRILKAFPGKWSKSVNCEDKATLDYTNYAVAKGVSMNCRSAPPPPSCQIVEELVEIPAQPARKELRKVVKCTPDVEQATDEAAIMAAI